MARRLSPWGLSLVLLALLAALLPELCAADDDGSSRQYDGKTGAKKLIAEMKKKGYNTALSLFESTGGAKEFPATMSYYRLTVLAPTDEAILPPLVQCAPICLQTRRRQQTRREAKAPTDDAFASRPQTTPLPRAHRRRLCLAPTDDAFASRPQTTPLPRAHRRRLCLAPTDDASASRPQTTPLPRAHRRRLCLAPTDDAFAKLPARPPPCILPPSSPSSPRNSQGASRSNELLPPHRSRAHRRGLSPNNTAPPSLPHPPPHHSPLSGIAKELPEAMSYYRLTVLAPTDEAFAKLSSSVTKGLSKAAMRDITMLHIVKGRKTAATLIRMRREHELPESVTKGLSKAAMRDITMLHTVKGRKTAATLIRMQREHELDAAHREGQEDRIRTCRSYPELLDIPGALSNTGEAGSVKPVNLCVTFPLFPSLSLSSPLFPSPLPSSPFSSPLPSQWRTPSKAREAGLFKATETKVKPVNSVKPVKLCMWFPPFPLLPSPVATSFQERRSGNGEAGRFKATETKVKPVNSVKPWRTPSKNGEAGLFKATEAKVKPVKLHAEGGKNVTITKPDSVLLTISAVHGIDKVIIPGGKLTGAKKKLSLKECLDLSNGEEDLDYDN
ncbi:unnamed protein product [Closterium sp. NIES-64]|nr:unnamed protein product [Closterium sp. NIES-64]